MTFGEFEGSVFYCCRYNKALRKLAGGVVIHGSLNCYDKDGYYHMRDDDVIFPLPEEEWCAENRRLFDQDVIESGGWARTNLTIPLVQRVFRVPKPGEPGDMDLGYRDYLEYLNDRFPKDYFKYAQWAESATVGQSLHPGTLARGFIRVK